MKGNYTRMNIKTVGMKQDIIPSKAFSNIYITEVKMKRENSMAVNKHKNFHELIVEKKMENEALLKMQEKLKNYQKLRGNENVINKDPGSVDDTKQIISEFMKQKRDLYEEIFDSDNQIKKDFLLKQLQLNFIKNIQKDSNEYLQNQIIKLKERYNFLVNENTKLFHQKQGLEKLIDNKTEINVTKLEEEKERLENEKELLRWNNANEEIINIQRKRMCKMNLENIKKDKKKSYIILEELHSCKNVKAIVSASKEKDISKAITSDINKTRLCQTSLREEEKYISKRQNDAKDAFSGVELIKASINYLCKKDKEKVDQLTQSRIENISQIISKKKNENNELKDSIKDINKKKYIFDEFTRQIKRETKIGKIHSIGGYLNDLLRENEHFEEVIKQKSKDAELNYSSIVELKDKIRKMKYLEGFGIEANAMITEREEELQIKENEYEEVYGDNERHIKMLANIATIIGRISALLGQSKVEQTISPKEIIDYLTKSGLRMERMNAISSYKPKKFNIESVNTDFTMANPPPYLLLKPFTMYRTQTEDLKSGTNMFSERGNIKLLKDMKKILVSTNKTRDQKLRQLEELKNEEKPEKNQSAQEKGEVKSNEPDIILASETSSKFNKQKKILDKLLLKNSQYSKDIAKKYNQYIQTASNSLIKTKKSKIINSISEPNETLQLSN